MQTAMMQRTVWWKTYPHCCSWSFAGCLARWLGVLLINDGLRSVTKNLKADSTNFQWLTQKVLLLVCDDPGLAVFVPCTGSLAALLQVRIFQSWAQCAALVPTF